MNPDDLKAYIDERIEAEGVCSISCVDGTVFTFSKEILAKLLARSLDTGRVVLFVQKQVLS